MLNPDGRLWIDRLSEGLTDTGERLSAADGERIVRLVAHHVGSEVHPRSPRVSAELPETGDRFERCCCCRSSPRRHSPSVSPRSPCLRWGITSRRAGEAKCLQLAVATRANILVAGGVGASSKKSAGAGVNCISLIDFPGRGWALCYITSVACPTAECQHNAEQSSHHQLIFPIDTVAVRPATRRRSGGTLSSLMRTGMRCARRTQLKVGLTEANSSLLVLRFWSSIP